MLDDAVQRGVCSDDITSRDLLDTRLMGILQTEVGIVFAKVLEPAGVYKRNENGLKAFERFISTVNDK